MTRMYLMPEAQHADCLHVLSAVSMIANSERVNAALEMLKSMQPVSPTAFICHGYPYLHPSQDDYCGNVEDHIELYTPEQSK